MQYRDGGPRGPLGLAFHPLFGAAALAWAALATSACVERVEYQAPADFELSMAGETLAVRQGEWLTIPVEVQRGEGPSEAIALEVQSLPLGFTVMPAEIAAGESSASVRIRPDAAPVGEELAVVIKGRAGGLTSSTAGTLLVMGRVGEHHSGALLELEQGTTVVKQGLPGGGLMFVSPGSTEILRVGPTGLPLPGFGDGDGRASYASLLGSLSPIAWSPFTAVQRDGKVVVAIAYDDPATEAPHDGTLLFRVLTDGKLDSSYGVGGRVLVPPASTSVDAMAISPGSGSTDIAVLLMSSGTLVRVSDKGEVLNLRDVGVSASELLMQHDGGIVAVAGGDLVRFHADLTRDMDFGIDGVLQLGLGATYLAVLSDGYLVGGTIRLEILPNYFVVAARLWRFDWHWHFAPGFTERGMPLGSAQLHNTFKAGFEDDGEIFSVVAGMHQDDFVGNRRDGSIKEDLAANPDLPGYVPLEPRFWDERVVAVVPHPPRRALAVRMNDFGGVFRFQTTGVWY